MISSGYFGVTENILRKIGAKNARRFVWEMFNAGGRISHSEYCRWEKWIEKNL